MYEIIMKCAIISHRKRVDIYEGCTMSDIMYEPVVLEQYHRKQDANLAFKKYETMIYKVNKGKAYKIIEYFFQKSEYPEGETYSICRSMYNISKLTLRIVNKRTGKTERFAKSYIRAEGLIDILEKNDRGDKYYIDIPEAKTLTAMDKFILKIDDENKRPKYPKYPKK